MNKQTRDTLLGVLGIIEIFNETRLIKDKKLRRAQQDKFLNRMRDDILSVLTDDDCSHAKYSDGHCSAINCWNYFSRCPKHSYASNLFVARATCTREQHNL